MMHNSDSSRLPLFAMYRCEGYGPAYGSTVLRGVRLFSCGRHFLTPDTVTVCIRFVNDEVYAYGLGHANG